MNIDDVGRTLPTASVVRRLAVNLEHQRDTMLMASLGKGRGELIRKIARHLQLPMGESFLFGESALDAPLPELVVSDQFDSAVRQLILSEGGEVSAAAESQEILVALPPRWAAELDEGDAPLLLLRDLVPPKRDGDARLEKLSQLLRERQYKGHRLPRHTVIFLTTDPKGWDRRTLADFVSAANLDLLAWKDPERTREEFVRLLSSGEILADVDIGSILAAGSDSSGEETGDTSE